MNIIRRHLVDENNNTKNIQKIYKKLKQFFDYNITKSFEILNFNKITDVREHLLLLENYQRDNTNNFFNIMKKDVNDNYKGLDYDISIQEIKRKELATIEFLQKNFNSFNFKCYDLLIILSKNNERENTWTGGGQQRKSQRKEPINNTEAMKKKPTKEPTAKEPTKDPKPKKPTKEPTAKEPIKDPKPKKPTKTPKQKEPTKTPKQKEPTKTPKQKEPTKTPKQKEPTKTPKQKEPKANKPTNK